MAIEIACTVYKMNNIIVIGGGLMGSSAAWQLSKYGEQVVLLEQQDEVYTNGSSFGESRISRSLGVEGNIFSYVQQVTVAEARKLIDFLNKKEADKKHRIDDIYTTSPVTYIYDTAQEADIKKLLHEEQKDRYECAYPHEAFEKFGMRVSESQVVIREYKACSGSLNPKVFISKLHAGIRHHNNEVHYNQQVVEITKKYKHYDIRTLNPKTGGTNIYQARKVALASGPYTGGLLKNIAPYFQQLITPKRVSLVFFKINKKIYGNYTEKQKAMIYDGFPLFDQVMPMLFAMIDKWDADGHPVFKIGGHQLRHPISNPDSAWQQRVSKDEISWGADSLFNYLNMLNIPITKEDILFHDEYTCIYSVAANDTPYVANILMPNNETDDSLVIIGGMSGIGAKGCLAYGLLAADLLLHKDNSDALYQKTKKELGIER